MAELRYPLTEWRRAVARISRAMLVGDFAAAEQARRELDLLTGNDLTELRHGGAWNYSIPFLIQLCADLGDRDRAALLYELLLPQAGHNIVSGVSFTSYGAAAYYLGRLAATLNRPAASAGHFEAAIAPHTRLQARPLLAHTRLQYAADLLQGRATAPANKPVSWPNRRATRPPRWACRRFGRRPPRWSARPAPSGRSHWRRPCTIVTRTRTPVLDSPAVPADSSPRD